MSIYLLTLLILCVCVVEPVVMSQSDVYVFVYLCLLERCLWESVARLYITYVNSMLFNIEQEEYNFCATFLETYLCINMLQWVILWLFGKYSYSLSFIDERVNTCHTCSFYKLLINMLPYRTFFTNWVQWLPGVSSWQWGYQAIRADSSKPYLFNTSDINLLVWLSSNTRFSKMSKYSFKMWHVCRFVSNWRMQSTVCDLYLLLGKLRRAWHEGANCKYCTYNSMGTNTWC